MPSIRNAGAACIAALSLAGCTPGATPTGGACQLGQKLPLDVYFNTAGLPFVVAGVNSVPAAMLVDTGATTSFVTPEIAQQAGLQMQPLDSPLRVAGAGGIEAANLTYASEFTLGSAVAKDMQLIVMRFGSTDPDVPIDGSLGTDIMKNYDIDFDFPEGKATFYVTGDCSSVAPPWTGAAEAVPITVGYYGDIYVPVTIDGQTMTAAIDTGSSVTNMSDTLFGKYALAGSATLMRTNLRGIGIGGQFNEAVYRGTTMTIGGETFDHPIFTVDSALQISPLSPNATEAQREKYNRIEDLVRMQNAEAEGNPFVASSSGDDIFLGESFLRHHRIFVSYATHMLYIEKN